MLANSALSLLNRRTYLAFTLGLVGMAFVLEHGFNAIPCQMCWWQRYVHWALLTCALLVNVPRVTTFCNWRYKGAVLASFPLGLLGLGIAIWQILVQQKILPLPASCGDNGAILAAGENLLTALQTQMPPPPCDEVSFTLFGLSLAVWNVPAMLLALVFSYQLWKEPKK